MNTKSEYFTRFPNDYVQGNIKTKYGISRKFIGHTKILAG